MKKFLKVATAFVAISCAATPVAFASATEKAAPQSPKSFYETFAETAQPDSYSTYDLTRGSSFTNYIWVRNGYVFNRFDNIAIEFSSGNSVAFEYYDSSGKLIDRHEHDSLSNWQSCGVTTQLWPNVKIKLVNTGGGTVTIRSGSVVYNYQ